MTDQQSFKFAMPPRTLTNEDNFSISPKTIAIRVVSPINGGLSMRILASLMLITFLTGHAFGQQSNKSSSTDNPGPCVADARWSNTNPSLSYSKQAQVPI